ncbi:aqualysin-1-like [Saccoglossus kowalevskii]|uniref:Uncharacterized protein LOC102808071 n=1 Tax=Saccoglossus kowalevskii TaxID=10224 RepID=A0ABM0MME4_SACKO|nr:PREDICTED: uncharacterized protein LOC102808071 [Saccoglossus kowalevskii]
MKFVILATIVAIAAAYHGPEVPIHLDRIDKQAENCPWNPQLASYNPKVYVNNDAVVYIVGHGLDEYHDNFAKPGGGSNADILFDFFSPNLGVDTNGLGTAIAGAVGGYYTGVGRNISLEGVRVIDEPSYKNIDMKNYEDGLRAVVTDYKGRKAENPVNYTRGVVLLCPYINVTSADTTDVEMYIIDMLNEDLVVVGPTGDSEDAPFKNCTDYFPGNMDQQGLITVGNCLNSNILHLNSIPGACNEIYAPGSYVYTSYYDIDDPNNHDNYVQAKPGSPLAAALVAGAAAMVRSSCPGLDNTEVEQKIIEFSTTKNDEVRHPVTNEVVGYMLRYPNENDAYEFCTPPITAQYT